MVPLALVAVSRSLHCLCHRHLTLGVSCCSRMMTSDLLTWMMIGTTVKRSERTPVSFPYHASRASAALPQSRVWFSQMHRNHRVNISLLLSLFYTRNTCMFWHIQLCTITHNLYAWMITHIVCISGCSRYFKIMHPHH